MVFRCSRVRRRPGRERVLVSVLLPLHPQVQVERPTPLALALALALAPTLPNARTAGAAPIAWQADGRQGEGQSSRGPVWQPCRPARRLPQRL